MIALAAISVDVVVIRIVDVVAAAIATVDL